MIDQAYTFTALIDDIKDMINKFIKDLKRSYRNFQISFTLEAEYLSTVLQSLTIPSYLCPPKSPQQPYFVPKHSNPTPAFLTYQKSAKDSQKQEIPGLFKHQVKNYIQCRKNHIIDSNSLFVKKQEEEHERNKKMGKVVSLLTVGEEMKLSDWIEKRIKSGHFVSKLEIQKRIQVMIRSKNIVSDHWMRKYLNRYPHIDQLLKQNSFDPKRHILDI